MNKAYWLVFVLLAPFTEACAQKTEITTFILLRHAEKANDGTEDPDLKPEGVERAKRITAMLKDIPVDAIYTTNYKRTRNTVAPLAEAKGLPLQQYEAFKPGVIEDMIAKHKGGTIVISGHSNNIPWTANLLVGKEVYKDFTDADYDNMLIVSVVEKGKVANVTWINY
jgi:2,3-bisphosphoglycerate-dependent phosphoglycerate mutase